MTISEISRQVAEDYNSLAATIEATSSIHFPPQAKKNLRLFSASETANLVGVTTRYLAMTAEELNLELIRQGKANSRNYSLTQVNQIRKHLAAKAGRDTEKGLSYDPIRRDNEGLAVVAAVNFKGGSAKSTTSAHFAQYAALRGYRVLMLDLDPQASASSIFGKVPEYLEEDESLYAALRYENPLLLSEVAQKTYFENIDLVPSGRWVSDWEYDAPRVATEAKLFEREIALQLEEINDRLKAPNLSSEQFEKIQYEQGELARQLTTATVEKFYFMRLQMALTDVADDYDIVVCDTAPNLGYLSNAAIFAANHLLVTIHPHWLDCESMAQYLASFQQHQSDLESAVSRSLGEGYLTDKTLHYLVTRHDTTSAPEAQVVGMLRSQLTNVLTNVLVRSSAITEAGTYQQTIYEAERSKFNGKTYDRAAESLNAVNAEIEAIIHQGWGRS